MNLKSFKLHPGKILNIILLVWIYGMGMLVTYTRDNLSGTRAELTRFYEMELNKCTIIKIDTLKYPGKGNYRIFYTNCTHESLPIFLDSNSQEYSFKVNSKISKKANTIDIEVEDNEKVVNLKIRHPSTEDDRFDAFKFIGVFMIALTIVILLAPNEHYDKVLKRLKGN